MKKILLIIAIVFCIFQMVVLATEIDIGDLAIDRDSSAGNGFTFIVKGNPANEDGKITSIKIWANANLENCEVAIFYVVSGSNFSTRDNVTIGAVTAGSEQTFPVDLDVQTGDYIGMFYTGGFVERSTSGAGYWYQAADNIPCTDITFSSLSNRTISLYGTGASVGWPHKWNTVTIGKWNNQEFTKWNDLE